jgi:drug/metabolite transporter (DMT)-like permease
MGIWFAIGLTLLSSTLMNVGIVLLKQAVAKSDRLYFVSPIWNVGMTLVLVGYGLFAWACATRSAPISMLQPLFAFGLVVVALLAVFYLHERFLPTEWFGVFLLLMGVVWLGLSAPTRDEEVGKIHGPYLLVFLAAGITLSGLAWRQLRRQPTQAEVWGGLLIGLLLGMGYLNTKVVGLAWQQEQYGWLAVGIVGMSLGLLGGLDCLLRVFQRGRALLVTAVNFVVNQVMVGIGGLLCLDEEFPHETFPRWARFVGLTAIMIGIVVFVTQNRKRRRQGEAVAEPT